jgi:hypothetical protein
LLEKLLIRIDLPQVTGAAICSRRPPRVVVGHVAHLTRVVLIDVAVANKRSIDIAGTNAIVSPTSENKMPFTVGAPSGRRFRTSTIADFTVTSWITVVKVGRKARSVGFCCAKPTFYACI